MHITQDQLNTWVSEAEEGYDPEVLKKRGRGRPGRGAKPAHVVAVRLTVDELSALDRLAAQSISPDLSLFAKQSVHSRQHESGQICN